jgi:hypothetical protein
MGFFVRKPDQKTINQIKRGEVGFRVLGTGLNSCLGIGVLIIPATRDDLTAFYEKEDESQYIVVRGRSGLRAYMVGEPVTEADIAEREERKKADEIAWAADPTLKQRQWDFFSAVCKECGIKYGDLGR